MLTEQEKTEQMKSSMEAAFASMTKDDMVNFLMAVSVRTGVTFTPLKRRQSNLEFLMELYGSGDVERIARSRVWFGGEVGFLASFKGDFGSLTYHSIENDKEKMRERAIEKEIMWLKEYKV